MTTKALLIATALIEAGAGLALMAVPSTAVWLLLGTELNEPAFLAVCRIAGAALLSLGTACWLARSGLVLAMSLYNVATVVVLCVAGFGSGLFGLLFWPGVVLHAAMAAWCIACLIKK